MKKQPIKFSDYPFIVPNEKQLVKKMEGFLTQIKECKTAPEALKVIKKINSFSETIDTEAWLRLCSAPTFPCSASTSSRSMAAWRSRT